MVKCFLTMYSADKSLTHKCYATLVLESSKEESIGVIHGHAQKRLPPRDGWMNLTMDSFEIPQEELQHILDAMKEPTD